MRKEEFENVLRVPANVRYEYFIKKVADFEEVWGLYNDGWAASEDDQGNKLFPFWPKKEFAEFCAVNEWDGYLPKAIFLDDFIDRFLPKMKVDGLKPSIFFNNSDSAVMRIDVLLEDLRRELGKYDFDETSK